MTARPPVRSGIIGTGFMGRVHTASVRAAGGRVVAYAGRDVQRTREHAERADVALTLTPEQLIEHPGVDVVHICTPNAQHVRYAEAAIAAGKHVVCEKPLALVADDAERLLVSAKARGVVHAVPFVYRYYPAVREARARLAADGERIWLAHGHYLQDWLLERDAVDWRLEDGVSRAFADIGVHWCDLFEFATGHRIVRLVARDSRLHDVRRDGDVEVPVSTEDGVVMLFETDRGATGSAVLSQATAGRKNRLWFSLDGERTSYAFDQEHPDELWVGSRQGAHLVPKGEETTRASAAVSPYLVAPSGHPQGYRDSFALFFGEVHDAIRGAHVPHLPTFADGVRAARLTEAVVASAASGSWIDVGSVRGVLA